jgi:hypothetical protein
MFANCNIVFSGWFNFENLWFKVGTWKGLGAIGEIWCMRLGFDLRSQATKLPKEMFGVGDY